MKICTMCCNEEYIFIDVYDSEASASEYCARLESSGAVIRDVWFYCGNTHIKYMKPLKNELSERAATRWEREYAIEEERQAERSRDHEAERQERLDNAGYSFMSANLPSR
jgi:hypothetical protein